MAAENSGTLNRSEQILQELLRHGEVSVDGLAKSYGVSAATIRRDLSELERQGLLRRVHGGALSQGSKGTFSSPRQHLGHGYQLSVQHLASADHSIEGRAAVTPLSNRTSASCRFFVTTPLLFP